MKQTLAVGIIETVEKKEINGKDDKRERESVKKKRLASDFELSYDEQNN